MRHERADTVPFGAGFARGAATEGAVPSRSSILVRVHGPLPSIHRRQGADVLAHVFQNSAAVVRSGVRAYVLAEWSSVGPAKVQAADGKIPR